MRRPQYIRELESMIERVVERADWEPGDIQRAVWELRDRYQQVKAQSPDTP